MDGPERPGVGAVARSAAFLAIGAYMIIGPFFPQVLGVGHQLSRRWMMFGGFGDVCDVRYYRGGDRSQELDRFAILGFARRQDAPHRLRFIKDPATATAYGRDLCRKLGRGSDVRVWARCGGDGGWRKVLRADQNVCLSVPRARAGRSRSAAGSAR